MMAFSFETDAEAHAYCESVVREMIRLFGIPEAEALGRVNRHFGSVRFVGRESDENQLYREDPIWWAKTIYYQGDSYWWHGEEGLKPKPYP